MGCRLTAGFALGSAGRGIKEPQVCGKHFRASERQRSRTQVVLFTPRHVMSKACAHTSEILFFRLSYLDKEATFLTACGIRRAPQPGSCKPNLNPNDDCDGLL